MKRQKLSPPVDDAQVCGWCAYLFEGSRIVREWRWQVRGQYWQEVKR